MKCIVCFLCLLAPKVSFGRKQNFLKYFFSSNDVFIKFVGVFFK